MPMKYMRMHVRKMAKAQVIITSLLRTDISCIVYKSPSSHIRVNHTLVKRRKKKNLYIYIYIVERQSNLNMLTFLFNRSGKIKKKK